MTISDFRAAAIERLVLDAFDASDLDWSAFCEQYELIECSQDNFIVRKKPSESGQKATEEIKAEFDKACEKTGAKP